MEQLTDISIQSVETPEGVEQVAQKSTTMLRVPCEVYSRVVGYLRPVQNWNAGKQQEFRDRTMFNVKPAAE